MRQVSNVATPTASMRGVALPTLKMSQYPAAVQTNSKTKKTMRLMAESLEIFNRYSRRVRKRRDGAGSQVSVSRVYVDPRKDVMEKQKVTNDLWDQSTAPNSSLPDRWFLSLERDYSVENALDREVMGLCEIRVAVRAQKMSLQVQFIAYRWGFL